MALSASLPKLVLSLALLPHLRLLVASTRQPVQAPWTGMTVGPDGPWQAVDLTLGFSDTVSVYPGGVGISWVLTAQYYDINRTDGCYGAAYDGAGEASYGSGSRGNSAYEEENSQFARGLDVQRPGKGTIWTDELFTGSPVSNASFSLLEHQMFAYPSGQWYPALAGCLSLGDVGYPSAVEPGSTDVDGGLIPSRMWRNGLIESDSFGLHIGSVSSGISGSLWWGGYDRSRVVGTVMSSIIDDVNDTHFSARLRDVCLDVVDGASPFDFPGKSLNGLLGDISSLSVEVDGCSPYLTLPKPVCDSITARLPVTHDPGLGLYIWDTSSDRYDQIVSSATALSFTLQSASNDDSLIAIRVPFAHLNLTLDKPLVERPTQYFPCFTGGQPGRHVLGRAFLQDAFIGANWGRLTWWLAQAPGPGFSSSSSATPINETDESIVNGGEDWASTWRGSWTALDDDGGGTRVKENDLKENDVATSSTSPLKGMSTGTTVGIGVAAGVAALTVILAIGYVCWRRRRAPKQPSVPTTEHRGQPMDAHYDASDKSASPKPAEVSGASSERAELWTNGARELAS